MEFECAEMIGDDSATSYAMTIVQLTEENDHLREQVRQLRLDYQKLQENNQRQQMHISILTTTCEQFVEELELSGDQHSAHRENRVTVLTPPSSGRSSYSSLPDSDDDNCCSATPLSSTHTAQTQPESRSSCPRCQSLAEELAKTRVELDLVDRQLQCAAKQKFLLQERLCHYEEDIGVLIQKGISHQLT